MNYSRVTRYQLQCWLYKCTYMILKKASNTLTSIFCSLYSLNLLWKWKSLSPVWLFANPWTVNGILQARKLEWVVFPFSRGSSQPRNWTPGLLHCRQILYKLNHKRSLLHEANPFLFSHYLFIITIVIIYQGFTMKLSDLCW